MAISYVITKLCNAIDHNNFSTGIFLDLSKAFDTVNHDILISKLEHYGVRGTALDLLTSYLCNRKQYVSFHSVNSTCGVPQGSVLGTLLFILYINVLKSNMIFCANQFKYTQSVPLILNNESLSQVKITKFLGVTIDENLTWKYHIDELATKISMNIGINNRLKYYLPNRILLTLYNSLVLPYLNYSILTWCNFSSKGNKLLIL